MMRIKVIMPDVDRTREIMDTRQSMLQTFVGKDTTVIVDNIKKGASAIDCNTDEVISGIEVVKEAIKAEQEGFDSIVIYCFSDIGIKAIRECVSIPVIGPGETTLATANILFNRFIVITTTNENIHRTHRRLMENPICRDKLASVQSINIPLTELHSSPERTTDKLTSICCDAIQKENIDGVVLGCMGLAMYGKEVEKRLGISVLDPSEISIGFAEMFGRNHIVHNRVSYPLSHSLDL